MDIMVAMLLLVLLVCVHTTHGIYSRSCLPGQETTINATSGEVSCSDCLPGTFSKDGRRCAPCTVCHDGQVEISACGSRRNSICQCLAGTYQKTRTACAACSNCAPGTYQTLDCSHNMDRSCRKCPPGLTTNVTNGRVCTPIQQPHPSTPKIVIQRRRDPNVNWWIPLIPGVFVVVTGFFAAVFFWRSRKKKSLSQEELSKRKLYDPEGYTDQVIFVSDDVDRL